MSQLISAVKCTTYMLEWEECLSLSVWLAGWLAGWLADWLADWLTDCLFAW